MPKYIVEIYAWTRDREIEAPSLRAAEALVRDQIKGGYDKRYWGFEIYAYSVNGEDF